MSEWQPIETAPKDGTRILAFFPIINSYKILTIEFIRHRWYICPYDCEFEMTGGDPTHWMPLPNPPIRKGDSMSKTTKADKLHNEAEKLWEINEGRFHE